MGAADYIQKLLARDRRRGTTLWGVFRTEDYAFALTADPLFLIAENMARHMRAGAMPPAVLIYSVTFDATCPDDVVAAVVTMPREQFLSVEGCRAHITAAALWRVLRHPHGVHFGQRSGGETSKARRRAGA